MIPMIETRLRKLALLAALGLAGCGDSTTLQTVDVPPTPPDVVDAATADEPRTDAAPAPEAPGKEATADATAAPAVTPVDLSAAAPATAPGEPAVTLKKLKWDEFRTQVATAPTAKFTLVDAWATNCGPCKENFPHLVEMARKYSDKGLNVVSLTLDDISDPKAIEEAESFLKEKNATFTNVLLDEDLGVGYEKLRINAIPAVFLYGPDGKEVKRYTMDDAENQFTYEEVERDVAALLDGTGPAPEAPK
jgi:thiol-disulfide isomerase/thioredoxin